MYLAFPPKAEFVDRFGIVRSLYGCSLLGLEEFKQRLAEIRLCLEQAPETDTWRDCYESDRRLRHAVERCLGLNGIEADWVTLDMVQQLLFSPGHLIKINAPKEVADKSSKEEPATVHTLLAILSTYTDLDTALKLAAELPADELLKIVTERAEIMKPDEQRKKEKIKRDQTAMKQKYGSTLKEWAIAQAKGEDSNG